MYTLKDAIKTIKNKTQKNEKIMRLLFIALTKPKGTSNKDDITEYLMHVDLPIRAKGSGCF